MVDEIEHVMKTSRSSNVNFCDNSFNVPKLHAEAVCREIISRGVDVKWRCGALKPLGMARDFCRLMKASGCTYAGLSIESASEKMLKSMKRGYSVDNVREALDNLCQSDIPLGLSILLGAPGETPDTISETFDVVERYPEITSIWVNIGIYLWTHHQEVLKEAKKDGQLKDDSELFDGAYYISPELSKDYMDGLIESLKEKNYIVQVNKPYKDYDKKTQRR